MADPRFYEALGPIRLADLAPRVGAELYDVKCGDRPVSVAASLSAAGPEAIAFFEDKAQADAFKATRAGACFLRAEAAEAAQVAGVAALVAKFPKAAFSQAAQLLVRPRAPAPDDGSAAIDAEARVAPSAVIGPGAKVGARTVIGPGAVIGPGVEIGPDGLIGPNAVVGFAIVGARARIHAGAVIGEEGFGLAPSGQGLVDIAHFGRVMIGDDVTIGACTTVDRGALEDTVIGDGSKIDNLVQIAHNVRIGRDCIIAGCCGLSGSVVLGDGAALGGGVGVSDHVTIGVGSKVAGGSALVMRDVPPGETWAGAPARPFRAFFRETAALARLAKERSRGEK